VGGDKKWRNGIVHQRIPPPPYTTQMPLWNSFAVGYSFYLLVIFCITRWLYWV